MGVLVVGMHRSGTSALARTVNLLGAALPKDVLGPSANNPLGHWEPRVSYELHNEILASIGSSWSALAPIPEAWFQTEAAEDYARRFAKFLRDEFASEKMFVLKDPRLCLLAPLWARAFALARMDFRVLVPLRPPIEVARSLNARNKMPISQGQLVWLRNVLQGERLTRGMPRCFLSYARLLEDWRGVMKTAGAALDLSWPNWARDTEAEIDAFISPEHRHQVSEGAGDAPVWVTESWDALVDLIDAPGDPATLARLDAIREAFDTASLAFTPVLNEWEHDGSRTDDAAHERHEQTKRKLFETREVLAGAEAGLNELGQRHEATKTKLAETRTLLSATRDELEALSQRHEASKQKLHVAREALTDMRTRYERLAVRYASAKDKLLSSRETFERRIQKITASEKKALGVASEAKAKLRELRDQLAESRRNLTSAKVSNETSKRKLRQARSHIANLKAPADDAASPPHQED